MITKPVINHILALFLFTWALSLHPVTGLGIRKASHAPVCKPSALKATGTLNPEALLGEDGNMDISLSNKPVYTFGKVPQPVSFDAKEAKISAKSLLGGKGANLADMSNIGLAVPPGFTLTTQVCNVFHTNGGKIPEKVWAEVMSALKGVEEAMDRRLGDKQRPLLVSVRSGAAASMPGMMDTVLNLGLNDLTVKGLAADFGERFALDSYRRFLHMFGTVVIGMKHSDFETALHNLKASSGLLSSYSDGDLTEVQLSELIAKYKDVYTANGTPFDETLSDPQAQLQAAIEAVFRSWFSERAVKYRQSEDIVGLLGTAVNVQAMVFGNMGSTSGTGVCFSRNPNTGEAKLYGEFLVNAQGEDVVAGIRTPQPIAELEETMPSVYAELVCNVNMLEKHFGDMQDVEFTIQESKLYMLQTRAGKRCGAAAVKIATDMVSEGLLSTDEAIMTVTPAHLNQLLHPQFKHSEDVPAYKDRVVAKGLPASPGAAVGKIAFTAEQAAAYHSAGEACILVRDETSPEDVGGMWAATGVLTARGGMTSHAAVVARGWGKPCVCGCSAVHVDEECGTLTIQYQLSQVFDDAVNQPENRYSVGSTITLRAGDVISLNGDTGEVLTGAQPLKPPSVADSHDATQLMQWVDERRRGRNGMKIMANADNPKDAAEARRNGAQGIGLTRTEHMFFSDDRIKLVRRMILAIGRDPKLRDAALAELLPFQRQDFEGILEAMDGLPVTVRLLDPPLHEFLPDPHADSISDDFAEDVGASVAEVRAAIMRMKEVNPMLGLRGCRLGVVLPELVEMQARALVEAALNCKFNKGLNPQPEIMIPLIGSASEFRDQAALIRKSIERVFQERNQRVEYKLGTMIEVPRAALTAEEVIEAGAEFFSYGTNDLTQMTFGFSRDDVGSFLPAYLQKGLLESDPFETIDEQGVGQLVQMSARRGRERHGLMHADYKFKAGICGEHGGDPKSIRFFVKTGLLDYLSCSPFRVPVARLAAAQAAIELSKGD